MDILVFENEVLEEVFNCVTSFFFTVLVLTEVFPYVKYDKSVDFYCVGYTDLLDKNKVSW